MNRHDRRARATHRDGRHDWYRIQASTANTPAEVRIYDEIGWYGVTADQFVRDLADLDATEIVVRLNSPGGDVHDGIAILNALRGHQARITTVVDGLAASAASFIAMAGDEIVMCRNSELMIHDAWSYGSGNAAELRAAADGLDRVSDNIASIYADRAGGTPDEWRAAMRAETWYSDQEAVDAGLADRIESWSDPDIAAATASFDLSVFNFAGRRGAPAPRAAHAAPTGSAANPTPSAEPVEVHTEEEEDAMSTLNEGLRQRLGITDADADEATILAALDEALEERDDTQAAAPLPDGVVTVEASVLEELRTNAARGAEARAHQEAQSREGMVSAAISEGRIAPARREHWLAALAADPEGGATLLASLAPGLIPVAEIGHNTVSETARTADDAVYASLFNEEA